MKKLISIIVFVLCIMGANAQDTITPPNSYKETPTEVEVTSGDSTYKNFFLLSKEEMVHIYKIKVMNDRLNEIIQQYGVIGSMDSSIIFALNTEIELLKSKMESKDREYKILDTKVKTNELIILTLKEQGVLLNEKFLLANREIEKLNGDNKKLRVRNVVLKVTNIVSLGVIVYLLLP